mmetsp:Transcript_11953/g.17131  ORF Transcript_11953/g.17131 Transcript_11953/m.17131 type:complete len:81 (+) Transcript_11953:85-327(+)
MAKPEGSERERWLITVYENPLKLAEAPEIIRADKEVAFAAVEKNGHAFGSNRQGQTRWFRQTLRAKVRRARQMCACQRSW